MLYEGYHAQTQLVYLDSGRLGVHYGMGGAVCNTGEYASSHDCDASYIRNRADEQGGAIANFGNYELWSGGRGRILFCDNHAYGSSTKTAAGGAIINGYGFGGYYDTPFFHLTTHDSVTFSGNTASSSDGYAYGGAISNRDGGTFCVEDYNNLIFSGNSVSGVSAYGGAIYNCDTFTLRLGGDVLFEKNAEICGETYCLRSIYSAQFDGWSNPLLNLSSSKNHGITFRDSIYAEGSVNLNQYGTGDIIFTGASTEADLREVKGGVDGTAEEILNSRTSEIATDATLYGGRLVVEDEAILKVNGLSVADGASVIVKDGTLVLRNGNATISTADGAEKAVMVGASLGESSLAGMDAEHRGSVDGAHIDLAEGAEFSLQHLVLGAMTRITDAPATLQLDDVTAELVMGVNASLTGSDMLMAGTMLTAGGRTLTLEENTGVVMLESTLFDSVTLRGDTLVLELAGMTLEMLNGAEYIAVSFTSGGAYASYDSSLAVTLTADGLHFTEGYTLSSDGGTSTMRYFHAEKAGVTPEPATAALSMLALAGLAARRRRKG